MDQIYEVKSTFLRLMKWVPCVFYEPAGLDGECLDAVLVMHSDEDYLDAPIGEQLAKRGFRVRACPGSGILFSWATAAARR